MDETKWPTTIGLTVPVHQNLATGDWSIKIPGVAYKGFGPERNAVLKADVLPNATRGDK